MILLDSSGGQKSEQAIQTIINNRCDNKSSKWSRNRVNKSNLITISPIDVIQLNAKVGRFSNKTADRNRKNENIKVKTSN